MANDEKREFIVAWARKCKVKNDIKIHCSAIFSEYEDSEISYYGKKIMIPIYEKDNWFDFFSELRADAVISIKNTNVCHTMEYNWVQIFYNFTSMDVVNMILEGKI